MPDLNLSSELNLKFRDSYDGREVFDPVRKKYVNLTPEEFVRQRFLDYLINRLGYPKTLLAVEKFLIYNTIKNRADVVVYDSSGNVLMVAECKAPQIRLTQAAFEQAARYNMIFKAEYLLITNGITFFCARINFQNNTFTFLENVPKYSELCVTET